MSGVLPTAGSARWACCTTDVHRDLAPLGVSEAPELAAVAVALAQVRAGLWKNHSR